jgi:hypothetical protein
MVRRAVSSICAMTGRSGCEWTGTVDGSDSATMRGWADTLLSRRAICPLTPQRERGEEGRGEEMHRMAQLEGGNLALRPIDHPDTSTIDVAVPRPGPTVHFCLVGLISLP